MIYIKSSGGYFYKKYKNGKIKRISKKEYLKHNKYLKMKGSGCCGKKQIKSQSEQVPMMNQNNPLRNTSRGQPTSQGQLNQVQNNSQSELAPMINNSEQSCVPNNCTKITLKLAYTSYNGKIICEKNLRIMIKLIV